MSRNRSLGVVAGLLLLGFSCTVQSAPKAITELPLQSNGDNRWLLPAGEYSGQFYISAPMHLRCEDGVVFLAQGRGNALTVQAPAVTIENCGVRDWGRNLTEMNAGIFVRPEAHGTRIKKNNLQGPGFGIWVESASGVYVIGNTIKGDSSIRSQDRGNGIHLFNVSGARVTGNHVSLTRDGIYIDNSHENRLEGNVLEDLRYGVHYMFSHRNTLSKNVTRRTRTGYALMQSRELTVTGNRSEQDENYGILMNYITYSTLQNNIVSHVSRGSSADATSSGSSTVTGDEGKALFIYNSVFNTIENNRFAYSTLGIHLTAGSEDNRISGNAFIENEQQVKYVATRTQEWSVEGRGNYWSDYLGWDRNGDGSGDVPYEPNDNVDRLLWRYPQVRLLMNSPAIQVLRWVQRAFPVVKSPGVQDSYPLMQIPTASNNSELRSLHHERG